MPKRSGTGNRHLPKDISILYEDNDILVVVKPFGLLTMGTDRDKSRTLYAMLTDYVRKGYSKSPKRIFIVHRLDRDTSGILIFAKSMEAKLRLQGQWEETEKKYIAVVHGRCKKGRGRSRHIWLRTRPTLYIPPPTPQKENCPILLTGC